MIGLSKEIKNIILEDSFLKKYQVYNIINDEKTRLPFIVVKVNSMIPEYLKDNFINVQVNFSVINVDTKYDTMVDIATKIKDKFNCKQFNTINYSIEDIRWSGFVEDYENEVYTGMTNFTCILVNNE